MTKAAKKAVDHAIIASAATNSVAPDAIPSDNYFAPTLGVKLLTESARMPTYGSDGAACFDLYASDSIGVNPGRSKVVSTGVAFEIPADHVMLVFSRSGHGYKHGIRLANCVGVIDSDYRGEVVAKLHNDSSEGFHVTIGDRIAQAMLLPVSRFELVQVDELSKTERGAGGFGSTGA
jgi:dUTP pyrophosphatase